MRLAAIRWMMGHMAQRTQTSASAGRQESGRRKRVTRTIMLAWLARLPFERRFQTRMVTLAIALGAVRGLAQQGQVRASEWDKRSRARALEADAKKALRHGKQAVTGG
jgi:hypothetical protein